MGKTPVEANKLIRESGVKWIQTIFTDLLGNIRAVSLPAAKYLEGTIWKDGSNFDGSSCSFRTSSKSDMTSIPDPDTFNIFRINGEEVAVVQCDICLPNTQKLFRGGPRTIASRAEKKSEDMGYDAWLQPEMEFYVFNSIQEAIKENDVWSTDAKMGVGSSVVVPAMIQDFSEAKYLAKPRHHYFSPPPFDRHANFREELGNLLNEIGVPVKYHHHELGIHQMEIEMDYMPGATETGDAVMFHKYISRLLGKKYNFLPSYMPKPIFADAGNGMHAHMYLKKNSENIFYDRDDELGLSQTARYYIGGLMEHAQGITAITNPTINSYKRLVPEFEAPSFITWSPMNRTALIRVPSKAKPTDANCEYRSSDPSCNPYLAMAVIVESGLDGIRKKIEPGDPLEGDPSKLTPSKRRELGISELPDTLTKALEMMDSDELVHRVLGNETFDLFYEAKKHEIKDYRMFVSSWEIFKYFEV